MKKTKPHWSSIDDDIIGKEQVTEYTPTTKKQLNEWWWMMLKKKCKVTFYPRINKHGDSLTIIEPKEKK